MDVDLKAPGFPNSKQTTKCSRRGRVEDDSELLVGTVAALAHSSDQGSSSSEEDSVSEDEDSSGSSAVSDSSDEYQTAEEYVEEEAPSIASTGHSKVIDSPIPNSWLE